MRSARPQNTAHRLRLAVEMLPTRTKVGMLEGIRTNRIIVGAYVDKRSGGICPMLAAHRNGGRTDFAGFAVAWDAYTNARRPRRATKREVRTLVSLLELSLAKDRLGTESLTELAAEIRADRARFAQLAAERRAEIAISADAAAALAADAPTRIRVRRRRAPLDGARVEDIAAEYLALEDQAAPAGVR